MGVTAKGFPYPDGPDAANVPADIGALAAAVDDMPGVTPATYAEINALTGGDVWEGRTVYQTNTGTNRPYEGLYQHNGIEWREPWNMPWGVLAVATAVANQSTIGAETDLTDLTATVTTPANRTLRIRALVRGTKNTTGVATVFVNNGTSRIVWSANVADGIPTTMNGEYIDFVTAGTITYKLTMQGNATAGTVSLVASATNPVRIVVEDIGPFGAAA